MKREGDGEESSESGGVCWPYPCRDQANSFPSLQPAELKPDV